MRAGVALGVALAAVTAAAQPVQVTVPSSGQLAPVSTQTTVPAVFLDQDLNASVLFTASGGALQAWHLDGGQAQTIPGTFNAVDVAYGLAVAGAPAGVVAAGGPNGIQFLMRSGVGGQFTDVTGTPLDAGVVQQISAFDSSTGTSVFTADSRGRISRWDLVASGGRINGTLGAQVTLASPPSGLAVDPRTGNVFYAVPQAGISFLDGALLASTVFASSTTFGLLVPFNGLTFYQGTTARYLLVANGAPPGGSVAVFDLNSTALSVAPVVAAAITTSGDPINLPITGIAVANSPIGPFTDGLLAVHDPRASGPAVQLVRWGDLADAGRANDAGLIVDTTFDRRGSVTPPDGGTDGGVDAGSGGSGSGPPAPPGPGVDTGRSSCAVAPGAALWPVLFGLAVLVVARRRR